MSIIGIDHRIATTGHHQTVDQAERLNQHIEQYLRCFIRYFEDKDWTEWLCMAEFVYNNTSHVSTGQPPFLSFNGFLPSMLHSNGFLDTINHLTDYADNIDYLYHTLLASQELYKNIMIQTVVRLIDLSLMIGYGSRNHPNLFLLTKNFALGNTVHLKFLNLINFSNS